MLCFCSFVRYVGSHTYTHTLSLSNLYLTHMHLVSNQVKRVKSLRNGRKKMSKSDPSEVACLFLTDDADRIAFKIRKAKTDSIPEVYYDLENRAEVANLLDILAALTRQEVYFLSVCVCVSVYLYLYLFTSLDLIVPHFLSKSCSCVSMQFHICHQT
jgi:tRNA synthetases class I (W and Y)